MPNILHTKATPTEIFDDMSSDNDELLRLAVSSRCISGLDEGPESPTPDQKDVVSDSGEVEYVSWPPVYSSASRYLGSQIHQERGTWRMTSRSSSMTSRRSNPLFQAALAASVKYLFDENVAPFDSNPSEDRDEQDVDATYIPLPSLRTNRVPFGVLHETTGLAKQRIVLEQNDVKGKPSDKLKEVEIPKGSRLGIWAPHLLVRETTPAFVEDGENKKTSATRLRTKAPAPLNMTVIEQTLNRNNRAVYAVNGADEVCAPEERSGHRDGSLEAETGVQEGEMIEEDPTREKQPPSEFPPRPCHIPLPAITPAQTLSSLVLTPALTRLSSFACVRRVYQPGACTPLTPHRRKLLDILRNGPVQV